MLTWIEQDGMSYLKYINQNAVSNIISTLQTCRKKKSLECAKHAHVHILGNGLDIHETVGNYIVPMFVECGSVSEAHEVFNKLHDRNEHSWTSLIMGYLECGELEHAFILYDKLQEDSICPSSHTVTALLRACAKMKDVRKGQKIHFDITKNGLEQDLFVGSALVDMYAKCGSLETAQITFDKLPLRDVVTWTSLIAGYAENKSGLKALNCFEQMQQEGTCADATAFACCLKACCSLGDIDKGRNIHVEIVKKGFERNLNIASSLVDMYAKCGFVREAREVFDKLTVRDVRIWTAMIAGYADNELSQEALGCFEDMQIEGITPDAVAFVCVLKACGNIAAICKGREIHTLIRQKRIEEDNFIGSALIDMYGRCGSPVQAQDVFERLPVKSIVSWNALIAGHSENNLVLKALNCFERMQVENITPNSVTFVCILKACGNMGLIDKGREVHSEVVKRGIERDILVGNTVVDMYVKCGAFLEAREVFDKLPVRDVVSWNALIAGYVEQGLSCEALSCFEQMEIDGASPNAVTFVCVLKACVRIRAIDEGHKIHGKIKHLGLEKDPFIGNILVDMYAKCGSVVQAREVFDNLPSRDLVSWNALIMGYGENESGEEALKCFEQMQLEGIPPNSITFVGALKACGDIGAIDKGNQIHTKIAETGYEMNIFVGNTLVDMYAKCGSLSEARRIFDRLPLKDVVAWNAMIRGHGVNYEGELAMDCFEHMQQQGIQPNAVTFICLLTACSRANLVVKAWEYFKAMKNDYSIMPMVDHYICMIDLLARSGYFHGAEKLLEATPGPSCEEALTALLGACKVYGETELALRCFWQLVHMNPKNSAPYVLMVNIYASIDRWHDADKIEELRKHAWALKQPMRAAIEVERKVSKFRMGDKISWLEMLLFGCWWM